MLFFLCRRAYCYGTTCKRRGVYGTCIGCDEIGLSAFWDGSWEDSSGNAMQGALPPAYVVGRGIDDACAGSEQNSSDLCGGSGGGASAGAGLYPIYGYGPSWCRLSDEKIRAGNVAAHHLPMADFVSSYYGGACLPGRRTAGAVRRCTLYGGIVHSGAGGTHGIASIRGGRRTGAFAGSRHTVRRTSGGGSARQKKEKNPKKYLK